MLDKTMITPDMNPNLTPEEVMLAHAVVSNLSNFAFRVLVILQTLESDSIPALPPTDENVATILGCQEKRVARARRELKAKDWAPLPKAQ